MPFGLTNAPAVFQSLVNDVLRDLLGRVVFVYLDNILIFSHSQEDHVNHVCDVLTRLLENKLFGKTEKYEFHIPSVCFLGYVVEEGQLRADPSKLEAVREWPIPTSRKHHQRFLGFANFYRQFIQNYRQVASPITQLSSNKVNFCWTPAANHVFTTLKDMFTKAPVLIHPDLEQQFVVEVDASDSGVVAILSQRLLVDNKLHPCAFFSRRLSPAGRSYDVGNWELLAVVLALQQWWHWLEGPLIPS